MNEKQKKLIDGDEKEILETDRGRQALERHCEDIESRVRKRTRDLDERVKELRCLYRVSRLVAESGGAVDDVLAGVVELIPPGWQYPEITCARITFSGRERATANYRDTPWKQSADILLSGKTVGALAVCYLEQMPESDDGPFLKEERHLIKDIARQLGVMMQRWKAEEALRESEAKLSDALKMARAGHWEYDVDRDMFTFNDNFYRIFRATAAEAGGYEISSADYARRFCHPDDAAIVEDEVRRAVESTDPSYNCKIEHRILYADGEVGWMTVRFFIIKDSRGRTVKTYGVNQDITELRRAGEERQKLEEQLLASQKIEAIGRLAGGVAHDFNNLLSVILSYTEFAMEGVPEGASLRGDLRQVKKAGERAATLTRQLLAFSRRQVLQPVHLSLNEVAEGVEKMLRRILGEDIDLVQMLAPDLGPTLADPGQIEQVLMNLVVNARDAMPEGGRLTIETSNAEIDEEYAARHAGVKAGPYVRLAVTDTGCGMDGQTKAQLFEPFFTTKGKGKGTGLGLSTVYGIVKQSGGNIWFYSEPGRGTTFKIYLPRKLGATATSTKLPSAPLRSTGTETILVVEDGEALREVARRTLDSAGYTVLTAGDGEEALLTSAEHAGDIHLLLTDVVMPGMGGRVLAEALIKTRPALRVLYMSGYTDDAIVHHGVIDPGTHFLGKPFAGAELLRKVGEVLGHGVTDLADGNGEADNAGTGMEEKPLDRDALRALPEEVLVNLYRAVTAARYNEIIEIIETVRSTHPDVAASLRRMADLFDYEGLKDLLRR